MFELPPPEKAVRTGRGFNGKVEACGDEFVDYMRAFVERTVRKQLQGKVLAGNTVTSHALRLYLRAYVNLFRDADAFPQPNTVLEATADVACRSAYAAARFSYDDKMQQSIERLGGYGKMKDSTLLAQHQEALESAMKAFNDGAEFGSEELIERYRQRLEGALVGTLETHRKINSDMNPYPKLFLLGGTVVLAIALLVAELLLDVTCSPFLQVCSTAGSFMGAIARTLLILSLMAVAWQFRASLARLVAAVTGVDPAVLLRGIGLSAGSTDAGDAILDVMGIVGVAMGGRRGGGGAVDREKASPASGAGADVVSPPATEGGIRQRVARKRGPLEE